MKAYQLPYESIKDCSVTISKCFNGINESTDKGYDIVMTDDYGFYSRYYLDDPSVDLDGALKQIMENDKRPGPVMVTFTESDMPEGFRDCLADNGFIEIIKQAGMNFDLTKEIPEALVKMQRDNIIAREIKEDEVAKWIEVCIKGFAPRKTYEPDLYETLYKTEGVHLYGAFEDGELIGTTMLIKNGEKSGIHEVGVPKEHRNKGAATAILMKLLTDMKEAGETIVSLQASDMGQPVYEKLGFDLVSYVHTWFNMKGM